MTPVADGNLLAYLQDRKQIQLPVLRTFFGCLTNAIAYLHSVRIQHMDIKPENILIKDGTIYVADLEQRMIGPKRSVVLRGHRHQGLLAIWLQKSPKINMHPETTVLICGLLASSSWK